MLALKRADGGLPTLILLLYIPGVYLLALTLLVSGGIGWLAGTVLLAHVLVLAAFLLHDCMHNAVFARSSANIKLGSLLAWITGAVYTPYERLREKHMRHHIERVDVLAVDYREWLGTHPVAARIVRCLTRWHLPAVDWLMHALSVVAPFVHPTLAQYRQRTLRIMAARLAFFALLAWLNPWTLLGYAIGFSLYLSVMGFMDAFQHSYDIELSLEQPSPGARHDRHYEEQNTYSNPLSIRFPVLNLLVLNFCFHNVHHQKPSEPWYRLPALHRQRYTRGCPRLVPFREQWRRYHHYRLERLRPGACMAEAGANGVSFLVAV